MGKMGFARPFVLIEHVTSTSSCMPCMMVDQSSVCDVLPKNTGSTFTTTGLDWTGLKKIQVLHAVRKDRSI